MLRKTLTALTLTLTACPAFAERDQIRIVGSSTVFPFTTTVAERFGKSTDFKTPVVEATGSGGGVKIILLWGGHRNPRYGQRITPNQSIRSRQLRPKRREKHHRGENRL